MGLASLRSVERASESARERSQQKIEGIVDSRQASGSGCEAPRAKGTSIRAAPAQSSFSLPWNGQRNPLS
jgi:hypothetical protein